MKKERLATFGKLTFIGITVGLILVANFIAPLGIGVFRVAPINSVSIQANKSLETWHALIDKSLRARDITLRQQTEILSLNEPGVGVSENYRCLTNSKSASPCVFGSTTSTAKKIAILGDSHALAILPAILASFDLEKVNIRLFAHAGCQVADVPSFHWSGENGTCSPYRAWSYRQVRSLAPDLTIIQDVGCCSLAKNSSFWSNRFAAAIQKLSSYSKRVLVLGSTPIRPDENDSKKCITASKRISKSCNLTPSSSISIYEPPQRTTALLNGADFISLSDLVCSNGNCPLFIGDTLMSFSIEVT